MTELFRRAWSSLFRGGIGWIMTAVFLMIAGATAAVANLFGGSADLSYLFQNLPYAAILLFPLLTERLFTAERRTEKDKKRPDLPCSPTGYVIGKYLCMALLFLIQVAALCCYPLISRGLGDVSLAAAYTALFGYLLFGAALLSICTFFALQFRNRIASLACNAAVCLLGSYAFFFAGLTEMNRVTGLIGPLLLAVGIGGWIWFRTREPVWAISVCGIPAAVLTVLFFAAPRVLTVYLPAFFNRLSPFSALSGFLGGHFDLPATVLLLSETVLFLLLSVLTVRRQWQIKRRPLGAILLTAGLILANLLCSFLPYTAAHPDVTGNQSLLLSGKVRTALGEVEKDVTVYYLSAGGEAEADADLYCFAEQIGACSPHITVKCYNLTGTNDFAGYAAAELRAANQGFLVTSGEESVLFGNDALYLYEIYGYRMTPAQYGALLDSLSGAENEATLREELRREVRVFFRGDELIAEAIRSVTDPNVQTVVEYTEVGLESDREIPIPILTVSRKAATVWSALLVGVIPLTVLGVGIFYLYRRKKAS